MAVSKKATGSFAAMNLESIRRFEALMTYAMAQITKEFAVEPSLDNDSIAWDDFSKLIESDPEGSQEKLMERLIPLIDQVFAEQQQGAQ